MGNRPITNQQEKNAMCNCNAQGLADIGQGDTRGTAVTHLVDIGLDEL